MKYILLIHTDREAEARFSDEERERRVQGHYDLARTLQEEGKMVDGYRLRDDDAALVRVAGGGEVLRVDGPYAETKEVMGGFYIVECADLAEACSYAAKIPSAAYGTIEVRRLYE